MRFGLDDTRASTRVGNTGEDLGAAIMIMVAEMASQKAEAARMP